MKISTKGRYAIRLMIDIGLNDSNYVRLKDAAKRQEISLKYLEQISGALQKAGLLISSRGSQGGYKLARKPEDYTVLDILQVTEGNLAPISCLEDEVNTCTRYSKCATIEMWEGLDKVIKEYLKSINLSELMEKERSHKSEIIDYFI